MVVGVVLGGNVSPKSFKAEPELQQPTQRSAPPDENTTEDEYGYKGSDYPNRRPFAFPLPEIDVAGNKLGAPLVNDWRRYDLAASYKVGDKLPRVPDGLCYVRIERPYSVEDAAWDADDVGAPPRPGVGAQEPVKAVRNGSNVSVWFRHAANEAANGSTWELAAAFNPTNYSAPNYSAQLAQAFPITQDGVAVILAGGATLVVSWLSFVTTGCATVTLGRRAGSNISGITASDLELLNTLTAVQLTVPAGFLVAGVLASAGGNLILRTGLAKETVMRCLNDSSTQSFRAGDLVYVQKTPLAMQDRYGLVNNGVNQSRKVHRLIGGISGIKNNVIS
jgi:hypothetical protein